MVQNATFPAHKRPSALSTSSGPLPWCCSLKAEPEAKLTCRQLAWQVLPGSSRQGKGNQRQRGEKAITRCLVICELVTTVGHWESAFWEGQVKCTPELFTSGTEEALTVSSCCPLAEGCPVCPHPHTSRLSHVRWAPTGPSCHPHHPHPRDGRAAPGQAWSCQQKVLTPGSRVL